MAARGSASLKHVCPEGIYLSLTPACPTEWSGVLFVRKGSLTDGDRMLRHS